MEIIRVYRKDRIVDVVIAYDKTTKKYGFVNLTDNHICKCRFNTVEEAIEDMNKRDEVVSWRYVTLVEFKKK